MTEQFRRIATGVIDPGRQVPVMVGATGFEPTTSCSESADDHAESPDWIWLLTLLSRNRADFSLDLATHRPGPLTSIRVA